MNDDFLSRLANEIAKPPNPDAACLGMGWTLTDERGAQYVIVGGHFERMMFRLCRIPAGMGVDDLGRKFRHAPTPDDFARFELI